MGDIVQIAVTVVRDEKEDKAILVKYLGKQVWIPRRAIEATKPDGNRLLITIPSNLYRSKFE